MKKMQRRGKVDKDGKKTKDGEKSKSSDGKESFEGNLSLSRLTVYKCYLNIGPSAASSNVKKTFVATGAPLSLHLLKMYIGKDWQNPFINFSLCPQNKKVSISYY